VGEEIMGLQEVEAPQGMKTEEGRPIS